MLALRPVRCSSALRDSGVRSNLLVAGMLNKQTAAGLSTVEKTVKVHRARVMEKMQVKSLAELVQLAARAGITSTSET